MQPNISENIARLREEVASFGAQIVLITKKRTLEEIQQAYNAGLKTFGENRAQEFCDKFPELPDDIEWHFVGHLQTNKVKDILAGAEMIHSGDRVKLLKELNKECQKQDKSVKVLLQFHIAEESSKHGFSLEEAEEWLKTGEFQKMNHIEICGVMGMATFTDDVSRVRREFSTLKDYFDRLKEKYFADEPGFKEISMGMSGDYKIALEEGSTMIRVGQTVFGLRPE